MGVWSNSQTIPYQQKSMRYVSACGNEVGAVMGVVLDDVRSDAGWVWSQSELEESELEQVLGEATVTMIRGMAEGTAVEAELRFQVSSLLCPSLQLTARNSHRLGKMCRRVYFSASTSLFVPVDLAALAVGVYQELRVVNSVGRNWCITCFHVQLLEALMQEE